MKLIVWFCFTILLFSCEPHLKGDLKFDTSKWLTEKNSRYRMLNDIIENDRLIGISKERIILLLGPPSKTGPCKHCIGYMIYTPDQSFSIDHEVLEISFDEHGKVCDVARNYW